MPFEPMTSEMMDAVFNYAKALHEGRVELPEGVPKLGEDEQDTIRRMIGLYAVLRMKDHNSIAEVRDMLAVIHPTFLKSALNFQPRQKYLM